MRESHPLSHKTHVPSVKKLCPRRIISAYCQLTRVAVMQHTCCRHALRGPVTSMHASSFALPALYCIAQHRGSIIIGRFWLLEPPPKSALAICKISVDGYPFWLRMCQLCDIIDDIPCSRNKPIAAGCIIQCTVYGLPSMRLCARVEHAY